MDSESESAASGASLKQEEAEQRYNRDITSHDQLLHLQRLEERHGQQFQQWVDEGIPREAMGDPEAMAQYRQEGGATATASADSAAVQRSSSAPASGASDGAQAAVQQVLEKSGHPIDPDLTTQLNERMDADFWDVRIHTGSEAAAACDAIDARAFTCGSDIVFNSGEYEPDSPEGQYLLAHELAHVKQQNGGAEVSMMPQEEAELEIDPDPRLEREADDAATNALEDGPVVVNRKGIDTHIQRSAKGDGMLYEAVEDLQNQVEGLENRQSQIMETMLEATPGAPEGFDLKGAAAKGVAGFAAGASVGSILGPGAAITGAGGAFIGMASAVAGDVAKETVGTLADGRPGGKAEMIEDMYLDMAKMYEEFIEERKDHADSSEGVLNMGEVTQ
ncbi:DUF4157 domain-containing protein [Natrinema longum]|uniref:DUF4157 domain-containing protein n=1 Tax=Natrinema longum TaxID=370324 RepID=A0A8A2U521_9EURY|nr:DUF4157 domain-containing protein [Natrinema longum]MBZ6494852.1 DUF4157 domain-containing protein [Natrinema longum]QSW83847.1 DUF4157 domain-containing protein [Natrinema longum]